MKMKGILKCMREWECGWMKKERKETLKVWMMATLIRGRRWEGEERVDQRAGTQPGRRGRVDLGNGWINFISVLLSCRF